MCDSSCDRALPDELLKEKVSIGSGIASPPRRKKAYGNAGREIAAQPRSGGRSGSRRAAAATRYLHGLKGIENGGAVHNQCGLQTLNVDTSVRHVSKGEGKVARGHTHSRRYHAEGDELPLADNSQEFVLTSHVIGTFSIQSKR